MAPERAQPRAQGRGGTDEGIGDQEIAAEVLAERLDAGGLVDDGADGGEIEPLGGADIAVGDLAFMLAVLFRGIENFKMFDLINLLTSGGPGSTTEVASITLKRDAFESWRTGYSSAFAIILFVAVFGLANIYVKALNRVKQR